VEGHLIMIKISVVVPIYNEGPVVKELHQKIVEAMSCQPEPYEIIFVNDGSSDNTEEECSSLSPLKVVNLGKNCGQTPALYIGICEAQGDIIVFIDADLQNDPNDILPLLKKLSEGYDVVVGWRKERKDAVSRLIFSKFSNMVARRILGLSLHDFGCGLKVYRSRFIRNFCLWGDAQVFLPAVAKERGAKICECPVNHYPRRIGSSKISISRMIRGSFDLLSVGFFVKYFSKPLRFFGGWGVVSTLISLLVFGAAIVLRLSHMKNFTETPLPIIGTLFAILGVLLFMLGLFAEMLLRIYYQTGEHSPYLIRSISENEEK